jgi:hypothetical protein
MSRLDALPPANALSRAFNSSLGDRGPVSRIPGRNPAPAVNGLSTRGPPLVERPLTDDRRVAAEVEREAPADAPPPLPPGFERLAGPERTAEVWAMLEEAAAFDSFEEALAFAAKQRRVYEECGFQ